MDSERRYSDDEVSEILDRATEAQTTRTPITSGSMGLTLSELHEIGREVGIADDVITRAATSLDQPRPTAIAEEKFLGQTIGVGRTVELPRPLTEQEWNRLVIDLRETFNAKGKINTEGAFRQWNNANLQALLEPTESGERLRLKTLKGNARTFQGMGAGFMTGGLVAGVLTLLAGAGDPSSMVFLTTMGAGFFFGSRLTIPGWARTRAQQFEEIIERVTRSVATPATGTRIPPDTSAPDPDDA